MKWLRSDCCLCGTNTGDYRKFQLRAFFQIELFFLRMRFDTNINGTLAWSLPLAAFVSQLFNIFDCIYEMCQCQVLKSTTIKTMTKCPFRVEIALWWLSILKEKNYDSIKPLVFSLLYYSVNRWEMAFLAHSSQYLDLFQETGFKCVIFSWICIYMNEVPNPLEHTHILKPLSICEYTNFLNKE